METNTDTDNIAVGTDKIINILGNKGPSSLNVADHCLGVYTIEYCPQNFLFT